MKTRTKVSGQYQHRYASGILMYRERANLIEIPANATVHILRAEANRSLCTYKDDRVYIPNENLPKRKDQPAVKAKKIKAVVQAETPAPAPAAEPNVETPAQAPVAEVPEAAPVVETPTAVTAEPVLA